jgi:hypothetical protein
MPCIVALLALLTPRLAMFFIWLLTDWFRLAWGAAWIWPLLGFFLMPYTTLAYMAAMLNAHGVTGGWLVLVIVAVMVDLGHFKVSMHGRYRIHRH